jgi:hypothetical protein
VDVRIGVVDGDRPRLVTVCFERGRRRELADRVGGDGDRAGKAVEDLFKGGDRGSRGSPSCSRCMMGQVIVVVSDGPPE